MVLHQISILFIIWSGKLYRYDKIVHFNYGINKRTIDLSHGHIKNEYVFLFMFRLFVVVVVKLLEILIRSLKLRFVWSWFFALKPGLDYRHTFKEKTKSQITKKKMLLLLVFYSLLKSKANEDKKMRILWMECVERKEHLFVDYIEMPRCRRFWLVSISYRTHFSGARMRARKRWNEIYFDENITTRNVVERWNCFFFYTFFFVFFI